MLRLCSFIRDLDLDTPPTTDVHALETWSFGSY